MQRQDFLDWLKVMGYDRHGGQSDAAEALGLSTAMVRLYTAGQTYGGKPVSYPTTLALACNALANGLKPYLAKTT